MRIRNRRPLSAENMLTSTANSFSMYEAPNNTEMQSIARSDICRLDRTADIVEEENGDARGKNRRLNKAERIQLSTFEGIASPVRESIATMIARIRRNDMGSSSMALISTAPLSAPVDVVKAARSIRPHTTPNSASSRLNALNTVERQHPATCIEAKLPTDRKNLRDIKTDKCSYVKSTEIQTSTEIMAGGETRCLSKQGKHRSVKNNSANLVKDGVNCSDELLYVENRCRRRNGRGWRCHRRTLLGYSLCEYHVGLNRLRNIDKPCVHLGGLKNDNILGITAKEEGDLEFSVIRKSERKKQPNATASRKYETDYVRYSDTVE